MKKIIECRPKNLITEIAFEVSDKCTYNCSYCKKLLFYNSVQNRKKYEQFKNSPILLNKFKIKDICTFNSESFDISLINNIKTDNDIEIAIEGGEPTDNDDLYNILAKLSETTNSKFRYLDLLTNCSKPLTYYEKLLSLKNIGIITAYHPEYSDNDFYYDLCQMCEDYKIENYSITIILMNKYKEKIFELYNMFSDKTHLKVYMTNADEEDLSCFNEIINNTKRDSVYVITYDDGTKEEVKEFELQQRTNNGLFRGMKCTINKDLVLVNQKTIEIGGGCTNIRFNTLNETDKFINYYNNKEQYILCDKDKCTSHSYMYGRKFI